MYPTVLSILGVAIPKITFNCYKYKYHCQQPTALLVHHHVYQLNFKGISRYLRPTNTSSYISTWDGDAKKPCSTSALQNEASNRHFSIINTDVSCFLQFSPDFPQVFLHVSPNFLHLLQVFPAFPPGNPSSFHRCAAGLGFGAQPLEPTGPGGTARPTHCRGRPPATGRGWQERGPWIYSYPNRSSTKDITLINPLG